MRPFSEKHYKSDSALRTERIRKEFEDGFYFLKSFNKAVTIFGSARTKPKSTHYVEAERLAEILGRKGYAVITGGGPGTMEAANKGVLKGRGRSAGLNIMLPKEQRKNAYVREGIGFYYFFTRKVMLSFASQAYVFFPGGYGTLDEFFEIVTLIQTGKIKKNIPVVLIGKDFWQTLCQWLEKIVFEQHKAIDKRDLSIWTLTDDLDEALRVIERGPRRARL